MQAGGGVELPEPGWPLPPGRWELTAAEAYVLRYAPVMGAAFQHHGFRAMRLALHELVLRDALRAVVVQTRGPLREVRRPRVLLTLGADHSRCVDPAVAPLLDIHAATRHRRRRPIGRAGERDDYEGTLLESFLKSARTTYRGYEGYMHSVGSVLERRGLVTVERRAGVRKPLRYAYTAAGRDADARLERLASFATASGGSTEWPPRLAAAYLWRAGAAVLMIDDQWPELGLLGRIVTAARSPEAIGGGGDSRLEPRVASTGISWNSADLRSLETLDRGLESSLWPEWPP